MDPVDIREQRVATGRVTVVDEEMAPLTPAAVIVPAVPVVRESAVASRATISETRVGRYPVAYRATQAIWLVVGVLDAVLLLDFLFRALRANDTGFADLIYSLGGVLAAPFDGIFGNTVNNATLGFDRWADLMAIVIYSLVAAAIVKVVRLSTTPRDTSTSTSTTVL